MTNLYSRSLVWLRRDLRLIDQRALAEACAKSKKVVVVFIFDTKILNKLKSKKDARVSFIYHSLCEINKELLSRGSQLVIAYGNPVIEIPKIATELEVEALFYNEDYEPYAKKKR